MPLPAHQFRQSQAAPALCPSDIFVRRMYDTSTDFFVFFFFKCSGPPRDLPSSPPPRPPDLCQDPLVPAQGANKELNDPPNRLGHPPRMVTSERGEVSRFTDATTMDHFLMAYAGKQNKRIVERLRALGASAVGLTAMDGGIAIGRRKPDLRIKDGDKVKILHGDHSGSIERIEPKPLRLLIDNGYLPVATPPAISPPAVPTEFD